jgi:hypothetical protein
VRPWCKGLRSLNLEGCETLHTLMLWSDSLMELDLSSCKVGRCRFTPVHSSSYSSSQTQTQAQG